ncbi:MAG TPA: hypothetical protein VD837_07010 [Terriglobales bacterium]|nr:hypothetical protein [Terriglobales bacterium]
MQSEIIPGATELKINGEVVTVRELAWPQAIELSHRISERAGKLFASGHSFQVTPAALTELVTGAQDLCEWLVLKTTGKDQQWIDGLATTQMLDLIDAALAQNLRPDFFAILGRIRSRFPATATASLQSSISSSGKDTPRPR